MAMTRGRFALLAVLSVTTGREVALRCHVSPSRVSEWASGRTKPSTESRRWLTTCYRIRGESWDEESPRADRARLSELSRVPATGSA